MPNSGCWQYGQVAGSEISWSEVSSALGCEFGSFWSPWCSGKCGSGRLICTKHSLQMG
jgi:hypothetical protein